MLVTPMLRYRSIFISDVHLGTQDCQAEFLLEFLQSTDCENLYLVGDIVDMWKLKNGVYWPRINNLVVQTIRDKARQGVNVVYVPGNHDDLMRDFVGSNVDGIEIRKEVIHTTAQGERLLIVHGDMFDDVVKSIHWLEHVGSHLYELAMALSRAYNKIRRRFGYSYWSFAAFIKYKFANAVKYIRSYEMAAALEARRRGVDGIVCGHIHHPNIVRSADVTYINTGDWVEHCTAVTEDMSGTIELVDWLEMRESQQHRVDLQQVA